MFKRKKTPQNKTKRDSNDSAQGEAQTLGKPKVTSSSSAETKQQTVRNEPVALDLNRVTTQRVTLENVIKETDDGRSPYTVAVDLDRKKYVIKARTGDVDDHVVNTNILRALSIPGVRAPAAAKTTPEFAAELDGKLRLASRKDRKIELFLDALNSKQIPGQLSERAPGQTLEKILDRPDSGPMLDVVEDAANSDAAIDGLLKAIPRPGHWGKDRQAEFDRMKETVRNTSGGKRAVAIKALKDELSSPQSLKRIEIIGDVHTLGWKKAVNKGREENQALAQTEDALRSLVKTPEGAYALGALCVADLLCGMNDRIMEKWNGANFMFDGEKGVFWCIDNAKHAEYGLSAGNEDSWRAWVAGLKATGQKVQLAELVYDSAYGRSVLGAGINDGEQKAIETAISRAVTETLAKAETLLNDEGMPATVRNKLRGRIETLKPPPEGDQKETRPRRGAVIELTDQQKQAVAHGVAVANRKETERKITTRPRRGAVIELTDQQKQTVVDSVLAAANKRELAIATAKRLWGEQHPLPSDAQSQNTILKAVEWWEAQQEGTTTRADFIRRLSVMLKVTHPSIRERRLTV